MEIVVQCILISLLRAGALVVAQNLLLQADTPRDIAQMEIEAKRHFVHVLPLSWKRYQVYVLCSCCRQKTLGHGTTEIQWLWSRHYVRVCFKILPNQGRWSQRLHSKSNPAVTGFDLLVSAG